MQYKLHSCFFLSIFLEPGGASLQWRASEQSFGHTMGEVLETG